MYGRDADDHLDVLQSQPRLGLQREDVFISHAMSACANSAWHPLPLNFHFSVTSGPAIVRLRENTNHPHDDRIYPTSARGMMYGPSSKVANRHWPLKA